MDISKYTFRIKIEYKKTFNPDYTQLINDYWLIKDNKFEYKIKFLLENHSFKSFYAMHRIIKDNATFYCIQHCPHCNCEMQNEVESRNSLWYFLGRSCDACLDSLQNENRIHYEERTNKNRISKFEKAFFFENWLKLSQLEFALLHRIVNLSETDDIIDHIYFGNVRDKEIGNVIRGIEMQNLIERDTNSDKIIFDPRLKKAIENIDINRLNYTKEDSKSTETFYLTFNHNENRIHEKQPIILGKIKFKELIVLNSSYKYAGWIDEFSNLTIKFSLVE